MCLGLHPLCFLGLMCGLFRQAACAEGTPWGFCNMPIAGSVCVVNREFSNVSPKDKPCSSCESRSPKPCKQSSYAMLCSYTAAIHWWHRKLAHLVILDGMEARRMPNHCSDHVRARRPRIAGQKCYICLLPPPFISLGFTIASAFPYGAKRCQ